MAAAQSPGENTMFPLPQALLRSGPLEPKFQPRLPHQDPDTQGVAGQCDKRDRLGPDSQDLITFQDGEPRAEVNIEVGSSLPRLCSLHMNVL